jgi:hypothetical protein
MGRPNALRTNAFIEPSAGPSGGEVASSGGTAWMIETGLKMLWDSILPAGVFCALS